MNKKKAIQLLSLLPMTVLDSDFNSPTVEAIEMAIEALRQMAENEEEGEKNDR